MRQALGQLPHPTSPTTGLPYAPPYVAQQGPAYRTPYGVVSPYGTAYASPYSPYGASFYPGGPYQANLTTTTTFNGTTLLLGIGAVAALYYLMKKR